MVTGQYNRAKIIITKNLVGTVVMIKVQYHDYCNITIKILYCIKDTNINTVLYIIHSGLS